MCLAVVLGVAAPGAGQAPRGHLPRALKLLETLTVPGTTGSKQIPTRTTLKKGASYRLVVSGTVTTSFTQPNGVTIGEREDAFYCYDEINEAGVSPSSSCSRNIRRLDPLRLENGVGFIDRTLGIPGIAYQPSHRYVLDFKAPRTGTLNFVTTILAALKPVGSFRVELYGASSKKAKKRKKRVSGCPAARNSNAHASSRCYWAVDFKISQDGVPKGTFPDPPHANPRGQFVKSETTAAGRVFFNAKPKEGRTSVGRAAGVFTHTDIFQSPVNPFEFPEGEIKLEFLTAEYRNVLGDIRLKLYAVVSSVSGTVFSQDPSGASVQGGDKAGVWVRSDLPFHREDYLLIRLGCASCINGSAGFNGLHVHDYRPGSPNNKLKLTIGKPKPV